MEIEVASLHELELSLAEGQQPARSLTSALLAQLRAEILCCKLVPGEKIQVSAIAKERGVSLSVVREALSRLVAEGWVEARDQRGFRVSPVSIVDLRDINLTRIEIDKIALRQSIELGDAEWENRVRESYRALKGAPRSAPGDSGPVFTTWTDLHLRFHATLVSACPAHLLLKFQAFLFQKCERYRFLSYSLSPRDVEGEHHAIVEAVLDRDTEAAVAALMEHYTTTAEIIIQGLSALNTEGQGHEPTSNARKLEDNSGRTRETSSPVLDETAMRRLLKAAKNVGAEK